ncbi:hypothetical protein CWC17_11010 [Pseudoalteromonas sp. S3785]|uniref:hypothetical protein n=1 Tax=Pseudoalteromonas sp. S3785 TaxID=579545 RepID=UPI00110A9264|nr:hypothetical protein [Pseudoalteromonas sp. S3785]TMO73382.1 hypothetical protein CWC17_11010 [Pseudoalteromonas sp. S3785]
MNWNQFGYICRVYSSKKLSGAQKEELTTQSYLTVYANKYADSKLANILAAKFTLQDADILQKQAMHYQCVPQLVSGYRFEHKGILSYLTAVFFIYIFSSLLYQTFVVPAFVEIYSNHMASAAHTLGDHFSYWYVPIILLVLLQSIIFIVIFKIKNACAFTDSQPFTGLSKALLPRSLIKKYDRLMITLNFAINFKEGENASTAEVKHLVKCASLGLESHEEFKVLLEQQLRQFNLQAKGFINKLVILYGLVIVVSIYLFVKAAYQPIFMLGEVL